MEYRTEKDSMGEMKLPKDALYGAQTQRAVENFPISGEPLPREFIAALGLDQAAAARVNLALGLLDAETAQADRAGRRAGSRGASGTPSSRSTCSRPAAAPAPT